MPVVTAGSRKEVKKIPVKLRKLKINCSSEKNILKRYLWKLKEDTHFFRTNIHVAFSFFVIWIGIEFYIFMRWGESGGQTLYIESPPV